MALTRKLLKSFALEESVVDSIIEAHAETVDGLKAQIAEAAKTAESMQAVTRERDELKNQLVALQKAGGDAAKIQKDFDDYKAAIEVEKTNAKKQTAMRALLKDSVGIKREKALDLIMAAEKLDGYELGENDQFKDSESIIAAMKEKHADWIGEVKDEGIPPLNPPGGGTKTDVETLGNMSMSDYIAARKKR